VVWKPQGIDKEGFKRALAQALHRGEDPTRYRVAAIGVLGEIEGLEFLTVGWAALAATMPRLGQAVVPSPVVPARPVCCWELQVVERCQCPGLPEDAQQLRHVHECGHPQQDGALCTRGPNNGRVVCCALCKLWEQREAKEAGG
jgi:hypothetical protein